MRPQHYLTCLWPGLAELWWRGRLSALPTALAFAAALNAMLIMRFLYPEWLSATLVRVACWVGIAAWLFTVVRGVRELPALIAPRVVSEEPDCWPDAVKAYLTGSWGEAEGLLADVLAIEPRDPPALLMLAAVYRHSERFDAAEDLLVQIARTEAADAWWLERDAEQRRLERDRAAFEEKRKATEESNPAEDETSKKTYEEQPSAAEQVVEAANT